MIGLSLFAMLAVTLAPMPVAQTVEAGPAPLSAEQLLGVARLHSKGAAMDPDGDSVATAGSGRPEEARGRPRISKTRCALVGCEPQCNIKGTRDAQGGLIFRTPANPGYRETTGDKVFCSRADAKAAGYREEGQG